MDSFDFNYKHYVIIQELPYLKTIKNYLPFDTNNTHINKIVNCMVGNVKVFLYYPTNNIREDFTKKFYTRFFDINTSKIENIVLAKIVYKCTLHGPPLKYFNFYYELKSIYKPPEKFFIQGNHYKIKDNQITYETTGSSIFYSDLSKQEKRNNSGVDYEKFIASKYELNKYHVELNGIKKGVKDGGIDLIAIKKEKIVLVQCKNWALSNSYKINQKDLRAFIGDCYLYLRETNISNRKVSFHFIVSHNNILTKTAEIFLNKNKFIKFKVVPFEL